MRGTAVGTSCISPVRDLQPWRTAQILRLRVFVSAYDKHAPAAWSNTPDLQAASLRMFTSRSPGKGARGPLSLLKPSWVSLVLLCALLHRVAGQHADVSAVAATPEASAATADVAVAMAAKSSALAKSLTPQSVTLSIVLGGACPVSVDAAQQLLTPALINDLSRLTGLALQGPPNPVVTNLTDGTFVTKVRQLAPAVCVGGCGVGW